MNTYKWKRKDMTIFLIIVKNCSLIQIEMNIVVHVMYLLMTKILVRIPNA